ncbi:zinc finger protein zpr1 [Grosmannia clavigera kw1407]|uniref:Zinc finger protein zpr1 n=1 Tax=Grosmannia clavigera (strain kw1407 / UAMH 11150) TaxID=655863 RepID=F0XRS1_GROCL|nr:zinc finger protein zpr1 [Grosmannia clavigera kw1407]EFW99504.1 zinc finger protein zpr1 [Grosmannia clavigera kw1407]
MSPPEEPRTTGTPAHEVFGTIGNQAEQVAPATDGVEGDNDQRVVEEIESLCMNCHENGTTRLLLTRIPYFREVILMSFSCDHCGFQNNEIQAAGSIQPRGTHYELRLTEMEDLSRQVVKADSASAKFVEIDVEVPAGRGQLTNVEGILTGLVSDLEMDQEARKNEQPEVYEKIADVLVKAKSMLAGESFPFRMSIDDPAGNSWIAPDLHDGVGKWEKREYARTPEQNQSLGLADTEDAAAGTTTSSSGIPTAFSGSAGVIPVGGQGRLNPDDEIILDEVYTFPASCPGCMHPCVTHMKMVDIPHFKQVVLMNTLCDHCGYRSNDVKTGGEVPAKGSRISLKVLNEVDLARDILKSESCALECPELNLSVNPGTLGGRFTTVEGLLTQVRDDLRNQIYQTGAEVGASPAGAPAAGGDSLSGDDRMQWTSFFAGLDEAITGKRPFTIVLADPLASSYVQSLADDPSKPDSQMTIVEYDRTAEEEEDLGLSDMKTEGYEGEAEAAEAAHDAQIKEDAAKADAAIADAAN